jgi:hypothetical protein
MGQKILFVSWDGPQTSYMEGLFAPIFQEISSNSDVEFHVLQFTWTTVERTEAIKLQLSKMNIKYSSISIIRKPISSIGSFLTLFTGATKIATYIKQNGIDIVMPRSTFPAYMVNQIKDKSFKIIFDADGLPIEERVDFSGLKRGSMMYRFLKNAETSMLRNANRVITRSQKSIEIHLQNIGEINRSKFSVVLNGRNIDLFTINQVWREASRKALRLKDEVLFVYAGSLGPQYCLSEMLQIFTAYKTIDKAHFLILTGNVEFAKAQIPQNLLHAITVKKVPSNEVSYWVNGADLAFGLRMPTCSMQGVAPIKLGEYLLCGIPTIASKGIGDTEKILIHFEECLLYDHQKPTELDKIVKFVEKVNFLDRNQIRLKAISCFSLKSSAESYLKAINLLSLTE